METRLTFFVIAIFFNITFSALLLFGIHKAFAGVSQKVTGVMREIEANTAAREWLQSVLSASEQAVAATQSTKQQIAEFDPRLENLQARYGFLLAQIDTRMDRICRTISENATLVRDAVTDPAEKFGATAAGIYNVLSLLAPKAETL